ncbi:ADP-ribose 1''-phosphate phophatase related protein [hydrothermal vent metagenome]|uniref:ADP-ribose 1''-phosphate phophatase related protein n=1 Tax=hydrothermal vent metagenome TaxID=652676 RepID=A0A1W1EHY9_9ZZZZ
MDKEDKLKILKKLNIKYIYHITHLDNLDNILEYGLYPHGNKYQKKDISNNEVNDRRVKKESIYNKSIHSYVPFYFNPRNAMLYRNQRYFGNDIIILGYDNSIACKNGTIFTTRNASSDKVEFTNNIFNIFKFKWKDIFAKRWTKKFEFEDASYKFISNDTIKQRMMAEVLIENRVKNKNINVIFTQDSKTAKFIVTNFRVDNIEVVVNQSLFFKDYI